MRIIKTICNDKSFQTCEMDTYTHWDTLCQRVKDELIITDDSLYITYCSIGKGIFFRADKLLEVKCDEHDLDCKFLVKIGDEYVPHRMMITKIC